MANYMLHFNHTAGFAAVQQDPIFVLNLCYYTDTQLGSVLCLVLVIGIQLILSPTPGRSIIYSGLLELIFVSTLGTDNCETHLYNWQQTTYWTTYVLFCNIYVLKGHQNTNVNIRFVVTLSEMNRIHEIFKNLASTSQRNPWFSVQSLINYCC